MNASIGFLVDRVEAPAHDAHADEQPFTPQWHKLRLAQRPFLERVRYLRTYQVLQALKNLQRDERKLKSSLPLFEKLRLWRRGFLSDVASIYPVSDRDLDDYVDEFTRRSRCRWTNVHAEFANHKLVLRSFLLAMGFRQAETVAITGGGRIVFQPFAPEARDVALSELRPELLRLGGEYILKPENAAVGDGILLLDARDGTLRARRGRAEVPLRERDLGRSTFIIERRLRQAEFWRELFPESGNTMRLLTLWTPGEPAPFLARGVQRIGTLDTIPTDNASGGGIAVPIDLATGELGLGRRYREDLTETRFARHPNTGARIEGAVLPHWDVIRQTVLQAALRFPYNPQMGWDVLMDETDTPVIIEGNSNPGVNTLQIGGGLLADPRIRSFYRKVGVI